jgi:hypothetical protein
MMLTTETLSHGALFILRVSVTQWLKKNFQSFLVSYAGELSVNLVDGLKVLQSQPIVAVMFLLGKKT